MSRRSLTVTALLFAFASYVSGYLAFRSHFARTVHLDRGPGVAALPVSCIVIDESSTCHWSLMAAFHPAQWIDNHMTGIKIMRERHDKFEFRRMMECLSAARSQ